MEFCTLDFCSSQLGILQRDFQFSDLCVLEGFDVEEHIMAWDTNCIRTETTQSIPTLSPSTHFKRHLRMQWTCYHSTMLGRKPPNQHYTTLAEPSKTAFVILDYMAKVPCPLLSQRQWPNQKEMTRPTTNLSYGAVDTKPSPTSSTWVIHQPHIPYDLPNDKPPNAGIQTKQKHSNPSDLPTNPHRTLSIQWTTQTGTN